MPSCDASPYRTGVGLSHVIEDGSEKTVAFAWHFLAPAEKKCSQLDKEALAIVFGVKKFHRYLFGRQFTICSDHKPLQHLFSSTVSFHHKHQQKSNVGHWSWASMNITLSINQETASISSINTIWVFRTLFATHGLPEVVVSDNGTAFTICEFQEFIYRNGIQHVRSAPYHPSTMV